MISTIRPLNYIEKIGNGESLVRDVRLSDVVICDNTEDCPFAVGIVYDTRLSKQPHITCRGSGRIAKRILKITKMRDVIVREDPDLAHKLYKSCREGDPLPPLFYKPVAKVLALVYAEELKKREKAIGVQ